MSALPPHIRTLEEAILDPDTGERIRSSVDGEWLDPNEPIPPNATIWDYDGEDRPEDGGGS